MLIALIVILAFWFIIALSIGIDCITKDNLTKALIYLGISIGLTIIQGSLLLVQLN